MATPNFNTPPTGVDGCDNDPLRQNQPIMVTLSVGTIRADVNVGNGKSVMSACSEGSHEHGKQKHNV